jgi:ubiquitin-protein ligase
MSNWWGTRKDVSPRLVWEVEAMRATFGKTFELVVPPFGGLLYWQGTVQVNMSILENPDHTLKIVYPKEYPNRPAEAYCIKPRIYSEKHQYEDGQLCLFNPKDGEQYGWNPSKSTAVTVAGWAVQWLYAYYTWRATGEWPGIEERIRPDTPLPRRRRR